MLVKCAPGSSLTGHFSEIQESSEQYNILQPNCNDHTFRMGQVIIDSSPQLFDGDALANLSSGHIKSHYFLVEPFCSIGNSFLF